MPMAKYLTAFVLRERYDFKKALEIIHYRLKHNAAAYESFRMKKLILLKCSL